MKKNQLYVGSIKDSNNVWHPVLCSPCESFVYAYLDNRVAGNDGEPEEPDESGFYTRTYTVELIDIVVPEDEEYEEEAEEWNNSWEVVEEEPFLLDLPD